MATLTPGTLLKLLNGMKMGDTKPFGKHRSALLQVTDILPIDVDEKDLWPRSGFHIKVSDSSYFIYVSLPFEQNDLILSNKMQLGQFMYVERLEPGLRVPIILGARPLPGRQPLVGRPKPIVPVIDNDEGLDTIPSNRTVFSTRRRSLWGLNMIPPIDHVSSSNLGKLTMMDSAVTRPIKERTQTCQISQLLSGRLRKEGSDTASRSPRTGKLLSKITHWKGEIASAIRERSITSKLCMKKSTANEAPRIPKSPSSTENKSTTSLPSVQSLRMAASSRTSVEKCESKKPPHLQGTPKNSNFLTLPGKLSVIGKVIHQRAAARNMALEALLISSVAEDLVQVLKMFSDLRASARPDAPGVCFDQFLIFHSEIEKAVTNVEAIQISTAVTIDKEPIINKPSNQEGLLILNEIVHLLTDRCGLADVKGMAETSSKLASFIPDKLKAKLGKSPRLDVNKHGSLARQQPGSVGANNENKEQISILFSLIKLANQMQTEAGNWFMEFIEAALETGLKKTKESSMVDNEKNPDFCPQSLIMKVISWVEMQQSDNRKRPVHPRAAEVARKLRIEVQNP